MKLFILYIVILIQLLPLSAQKKDDLSDYIFLGADYASNTQTFGVTLSEIKQPNYLLNAGFFSKYNFDINYSSIITDNADSTFQNAAYEQDLSLGYTINISDDFYLYTSYTHLFHSKNSYALKSLFTDILEFDVNYYAKYYNAYLSLNHIRGTKNMFYLTLQNAAEYTFEKLFSKNDNLNIQLSVGVNISDNNFYNEYALEDMYPSELLEYMWNEYGSLTRQTLEDYQSETNGEISLKQWEINRNSSNFDPDYRVTTVDLSLPVYYSYNNLMVSLIPYYTITVTKNTFYEQYNSFQLIVGLSYFFELN